MSEIHYNPTPGEFILLANTSVRQGTRGASDNELILTNQNLIYLELGLFGGIKLRMTFPLLYVYRASVGIQKDDDKLLQILYGDKIYSFSFTRNEKLNLRLWTMAICDQISPHREYFDAAYYDRFSEESLKKVSRQIEDGSISEQDFLPNTAELDGVAADLLNELSLPIGSLKKATQHKPKNSDFVGGFMKAVKDEFGITDIQNEFLSALGMDTEETNSEREERLLDAAFDYVLCKSRTEIAVLANQKAQTQIAAQAFTNAATRNIDEQVNAVKKLKELLDAGILTPEEFEHKKKELLNL